MFRSLVRAGSRAFSLLQVELDKYRAMRLFRCLVQKLSDTHCETKPEACYFNNLRTGYAYALSQEVLIYFFIPRQAGPFRC